MMEIAYYPGCTLHASSRLYDVQTKLVLGEMGIILMESKIQAQTGRLSDEIAFNDMDHTEWAHSFCLDPRIRKCESHGKCLRMMDFWNRREQEVDQNEHARRKQNGDDSHLSVS